MEGNSIHAAWTDYARALKAGQKDYSAHTVKGERGNLPALDDLINQTHIVAYMKLPQREIPLGSVVGTYTSARANSFATNFMPLHNSNSEFARKWINLCAIHMGEGLRDAVSVYEYQWQYYVIEGNKRVSILKYFDSPTVRADITRMVPQLDAKDPDTAVYYAFLKYDKTGMFKNIRLSSRENYERLAEMEARFREELNPETAVNFNSVFMQFETAYKHVKPSLIVGDAFLEYLKVYGLPGSIVLSEMEEQLTALLPQLELIKNPPTEPKLVLTPNEKPPAPGLISKLFSQKRSAKVVFAMPAGRTEDNWIGAHEFGRLQMQEKLGDQVESVCIDGLSSSNVYEKLTEQAKDANLLLITSAQLTLPALRFSLEHPDCLTLVYSRIREDYRVSTYSGRYYEAVFLCGMAAAMSSKAMKIAYVTPKTDYVRHTADINAFALGVKAVREDCEVTLVYRDVLPYQPATCARGLKHAAETGVDIAYTPRYPGMKLNLPQRVFSLVCRIDKAGEPTEYLAAPQWDWGRFYTEIVSSYLNGSLDILQVIDRGDPNVTGFWWGLGAGLLRFLTSDTISPRNSQLLHFMRSAIARDRFNPFYGPIRDQEGKLRVNSGTTLRPYEILNMEWLFEHVKVVE